MKYESVIFDWDGTLAKTLHLWLKSYRHELETIGYEHLSDEIIIGDFFYERELADEKYVDIDVSGSFIRNVERYMEEHIADLEAYPNAREVLEKLRNNKVNLALVSSSPRKLVKKGLEVTGLAEFFEHIVAGDDVMRHKPDPEPFLNAMEVSGLDPASTIIIGDASPDLVAARAAHIDSCLIFHSENKLFYNFEELRQKQPTHCVANLDEFADLINRV